MRRALTFLIISTALFLISQFLVLSTFGGSILTAGIFSIGLALIYVVFPVQSTKALALIPNIPLGILVAVLGISLSAIVLSFCILEFVAPPLLGYFLVNAVYEKSKPTVVIVTVIIFISTWLFIRKQQWQLIKNTWDKGFEIGGPFIEPITELMEGIWDKAEKFGESILK